MDVGLYACFEVRGGGQVGAAIAAAFGGDFAFAFKVGCFEVDFEVAPGLVVVGFFANRARRLLTGRSV
jgi:hypothetical protein